MSLKINWQWPDDVESQLREFQRNEVVLLGGFIIFPFMLLRSFHTEPNLGFLFGVVGLGTLVACVYVIRQPVTPFRYSWFRPRPISKLSEPELKVLTFLRSPAATRSAILIGIVVSVLVLGIAAADHHLFPGPRGIWQADLPKTMVLITACAVAYACFVGSIQVFLITLWITRHFQDIQHRYRPWPREKPFSSFVPLDQKSRSATTSLLPSTLLVSVLLLLDLIPTWHSQFFRLLRLLVCLISGLTAYQAWQINAQCWLWSAATIGLLFNPVIPLRLGYEVWRYLDVVAALLLPIVVWRVAPLENNSERN